MIDFPNAELLDDRICTLWLERHLHPQGLTCPWYGHADKRLFRAQAHFPAYRCRACDGYYTRLTGAAFAKTRQRPATLVLLLRGIAKGEPTARLARELGISRKQLPLNLSEFVVRTKHDKELRIFLSVAKLCPQEILSYASTRLSPPTL